MTDEALAAAALGKPDPEERAAFLATACHDDEQRRRVERLLAGPAVTQTLDQPTRAPDTDGTRTLGPPSGADETRAPDEPARPVPPRGDDFRAFLCPTDRADALGRLAHYEVLGVVGRGGFGVVLRAFDTRLHRTVALKLLAPLLAANATARARFVREARAAAAVRDDHVVNIHAVSDDDEPVPFLVMELIAGETLQQKLDRTGPLPVPEVLRVAAQIARGLAAAHARGLVHRDVKPANVLIEDETGRAKLTDFGLARAVDDASLTQSGAVAGTPMYMSPEQTRGETLDSRSDLFSLGSVVYALLTGRSPFRADSTAAVLKRVSDAAPPPIREVIPETPEWVCRIVEKLHAKEPADRFQTAREVADLLADCEQQLAAHKELKDHTRVPGGAPEPTAKPRPSRRRLVALVAALVLLPLTAWGVYALTRPTQPQPETAGAPPPGPPAAPPVAPPERPPVPVAPPPRLVPPRPAVPEPKWVVLFDGKDLKAWDLTRAAGWKLENGMLVGKGNTGHPSTARTDFKDFRLKIEARYTGGEGMVYLRESTRFTPDGLRSSGVQVYISNKRGDAQTGALLVDTEGQIRFGPVVKQRTRPGEWFTLEVVARGHHIQTFVNGEQALDFTGTDPKAPYFGGPIRFGFAGPTEDFQIRKLDIEDLLPPYPDPKP